MRKRPSFLRPARGVPLAILLLPYRTEHHVFHAVVLAIVLTLAAAPDAALLCSAWCHPQAAAASASHHGEPSAASSASHHGEPAAGSSVAGDDTCDNCDNPFGAAEFLREDLRRNVSAPDVDAVLVPGHQLAHSTIDARPGQEPGREGSLEARRLPTILRI
jgi:hypothetical protein